MSFLTKEQLRDLPDHRLKEYLKVTRKRYNHALYHVRMHGDGVGFAKDIDAHFQEVKKECATRNQFD